MKRLNKKGVSLAELLAVVVIMGIIAAIAIPLVGNVINQAKKKAFLGDLVTVAEATRTYCMVEGSSNLEGCSSTEALLIREGTLQTLGTNIKPYISKSLANIASTMKIKVLDGKYVIDVSAARDGGYTFASGSFYDPTAEDALTHVA